MPSCVVKCCKHTTMLQKKASGVTFHLFPKEPARRKKWIQIVRTCRNEEYWLPSDHSRICSFHFEDSDFYTSKCGLFRLNRDATPTKYLRESELPPEKRKAQVKVQTSADEKVLKMDPLDIGDDNLKMSQNVELNQYLSIVMDRDNATEATSDSQTLFELSKMKEEAALNSIEGPPAYETPAESSLRNQVQILHQKLEVKRKHIILLNQRIRRIRKANETLKNALMGVKNKLIKKKKLKLIGRLVDVKL